ncbi:MAG: hypothetical protein WCJ58_07810 [bacterium]
MPIYCVGWTNGERDPAAKVAELRTPIPGRSLRALIAGAKSILLDWCPQIDKEMINCRITNTPCPFAMWGPNITANAPNLNPKENLALTKGARCLQNHI